MESVEPKLNRTSSALALSATITVLFNTVISCAKGTYPSLKHFMASLSDHDWTTQGFSDVLLFLALGLIFCKVRSVENISPRTLVVMLAGAVAIATAGLLIWYLVHS